MPLSLSSDDNFSRGPLGPGSGANSTVLGSPSTVGSGAWVDVSGAVFSIGSDNILFGNNPSSAPLLRPVAESSVDSKVVLTVSPAAMAKAGTQIQGAVLRYQGSSFYEGEQFGPSTIKINRFGGAGGTANLTSGAFSPNGSNGFSLEFTATGSSPTTLTLKLTDLVTLSTTTISTTDSDASLQGAGQIGISNSAGYPEYISRFQGYITASASVSPTVATATKSITATVTGGATSWTSGTTFSLSGVAGATITSQSVNASTQVATLHITLPAATGTLTISDNADSLTTAINVINKQIFVDILGNSLSAGTGASDSTNFTGTNWPSDCFKAVTQNQPVTTWTWNNRGAAGAKSADIAANQLPGCLSLDATAHEKHITFVWEITNDLATGTITAAQAYANVKAIAQACKDNGEIVIVMTCLYRITPGPDALIDACNNLFRADSTVPTSFGSLVKSGASYCDYLYDVGAEPLLQTPGGATYWFDGVHLADPGYAIPGAQNAKIINGIVSPASGGYSPAVLGRGLGLGKGCGSLNFPSPAS